jgi:enoyl-CoA hydratase/carnithine racemase
LLLGMRELDLPAAEAWGLVNESCAAAELDERTHAVAQRLATAPRAAVRGTKALLAHIAADAVTPDDLALAQRLRAAAASSPERLQALQRRQKKVTG